MGVVSGDRPVVRFEPGTRHVLAYCTGCQPWRELRLTAARAYEAAASHAELVHGDTIAAKELRRRARESR